MDQHAFLHLNSALQQAPVLALPDYSKRFVVTTDASGFCCGAVLSQAQGDVDHPKLSRHEINWPTHEKGLFTIKLALSKWRHYLYGVEFDVFTDNSACKWFLSHPNVSGKLARWIDFFGQYSFVLHHVKGSSNVVADALSRVENPISRSYEPDGKIVPVDHTAKVLALRELSIRDLGIICDVSPFSWGGVAKACPIGVPQAITKIQASQLTMVKLQLNKATKRKILRGYQRDPLYKNSIKPSPPDTHDLPEVGTIRKMDGLLFVADTM
ncbi:Polyprotein [Phytophthora palmivora]|uniref:Polyprotein n=1 Tax=Phytophthora palmivora TaxID=4796 RepID=A0A2P4XZ81_9STRA|nr:Polyprotein [Phytophthora palmivora]